MRKKWTRAEIDILIREYPKRRTKEVARFTGHPYAAVRTKATKLGLKKNTRKLIVWHPTMLDVLRRFYPNTPNALLAKWLEVSVTSIILKAEELGLEKTGRLKLPKRTLPDGTVKRITPEQGEYIRNNIATKSKRRIAVELGFSKCAITAYCRKHNITKEAI